MCSQERQQPCSMAPAPSTTILAGRGRPGRSAAYNFQLTTDSPLIDLAADPGTAGSMPLWPQFEYVHPASGRARQRVAALDVGAYEFCGW
jgi:hypothetical protein